MKVGISGFDPNPLCVLPLLLWVILGDKGDPEEKTADMMMFAHGAAFRLRLIHSRLRGQSAVASQDVRKASVCYPDVSYALYVSAAPTADVLRDSFVPPPFFFFKFKERCQHDFSQLLSFRIPQQIESDRVDSQVSVDS